jgi:uncharacterized membrane protein YqiK
MFDQGFWISVAFIGVGAVVLFVLGFLFFYSIFYKKVKQGYAIIKNGAGGPKVSFSGLFIVPILHHAEKIDISVKRVEIDRSGKDGLICQDNIRADIRVAFFVRVNQTPEDVLKVAQSLGVEKASETASLREFFDAKFSEALKTVGKRFEFVQLYTERDHFKNEILQVIGTDLNGYVLDDAAIDYLEQTSLDFMNPDNILDSEGIKKITEITARERVLSNQIDRDKEKTIVKQDVEAREAILELQKQQAEAEEKQKREISVIKSREEAEAAKIAQEERLKSERARITTDEEVSVSEENKDRQIIIAQKSKERTAAVETERVEKDRLVEQTEKEKVFALAQIEKEKSVEEEKKNIQNVIRERVMVEKAVVVEEEKIKDTRAFAEADRVKQVALTEAAKAAEEAKVKEVKAAEASKEAAEHFAQQEIIEADAKFKASEKEAEAMKTIADGKAQEEATLGLSEVRVMEAKADAIEKEGNAKARVLQTTAEAEAKGTEAKALALEKHGVAEASVMQKKYSAEAKGIEEKANAMKKLDGVGKEHEEFKLNLDMQKEVELAKIGIQKEIADAQAEVITQALKSAKIDIVGGETMFFEKIMGSITQGKAVDRLIDNSGALTDIKDTFFNGDPDYFRQQLKDFLSQFTFSAEDLKNLTISALITKVMGSADESSKKTLKELFNMVQEAGLGDKTAAALGLR